MTSDLDNSQQKLRKRIYRKLFTCNDLNNPVYEVSNFARDWLRDHSNINQILDIYLAKHGKNSQMKLLHFNGLVRCCISISKHSRKYPYHLFKFDSEYSEMIARTLIKHPKIKTIQDLNEIFEFYKSNDIKLCSVSITKDNDFHSDARSYVAQKRRKYSEERAYELRHSGLDDALEKYYAKNNLIEYFHLKDLSLDKIREISSFDRAAQNVMNKISLADTDFEVLCKELLHMMKENPFLLNDAKYAFYDYPKYKIVINNLTSKQEKEVSEDIEKFYANTNAEDILQYERSNSTLDITQSDEELKKQFFMEYVKMKNKKRAPFHNLWYAIEDKLKDEVNSETTEQAQSTLDVNLAPKLAYKRKTMVERNEPIQSEIITESNPSSQKNPEVESALKSLQELSIQMKANPTVLELAKTFARDKNFLLNMKSELKRCYPLNFEDNFRRANKKVLLYNFIYTYIESNCEILNSMIDRCDENTRDHAKRLIDDYKKENDLDATKSTENEVECSEMPNSTMIELEHPEALLDVSPENLASVIVVPQPKDFILSGNMDCNPIKVECFSQPSVNVSDSDIRFEVLQETETENQVNELIKLLEAPPNVFEDKTYQEIPKDPVDAAETIQHTRRNLRPRKKN